MSTGASTGAPARRRRWPIALALVVTALFAAAVFSRVAVRTDMTDFLPRGHSEAARLMLREVGSGPGTRLVMLGIEGAPPTELARISTALAASLDRSGRFSSVNNGGPQGAGEADQALAFRYRYLLSAETTPAAFSVAALRRDMAGLLRGLQSSAAPLVARFGFSDPPGAFRAIVGAWMGASAIRLVDGVWFAPGRDRALILATTRDGGMDIAAQDAVGAAIRDGFAAAGPGAARLLASGPPVFARLAAEAMKRDVETLSIVSTLLLVGLLLWRFRSPWVIGVIAVPVGLGVAAGALAVQLAFGFVHGAALGFGMTMLGVTLDYPVLLIGHRKQGEAAPATLRRIGRTFTLAVLTASLGLTGMLFSGFPGFFQLGLLSMVGLLTAAAVTRWVLPRLIVAADLAPVAAGDASRLLRIEGLRAGRRYGGAVVLAAAAVLVAFGGPRWEPALSSLSPVPEAALALDAELRAEFGAPAGDVIALLRGDSADAVLQREERLLGPLDALIAGRTIDGAEIAARFLPSAATQSARRGALPDGDALAARVAEAQAGLGFREGAFKPFLDDVAASRLLPPLLPGDLAGTALAARLAPLLFARDGAWYGLVAPVGLHDRAGFAAAMDAAGGTVIDIPGELNAVVSDYTGTAWRWLGAGALAAFAAIALRLRAWRDVARVAASTGAALVLTLTVLTVAGVELSVIHIVSLQFVAGVGLDYALFFARRQLDAEERARTLRTLVTCNAMTVLTFGLLATCHTPLLRQIGLTVVIGAVAALVFAFLFAGERQRQAEAA